MERLILKNIYNHKFIYSLMGLLIVILNFYLIIGINVISTISESLRDAVTDNLSGHMILTSSKRLHYDIITKNQTNELFHLEPWQEMIAFLESKEYVATASPRMAVWGALLSDYNTLPVLLIGIDFEKEKELLPGRFIMEGNWINGLNDIMMYYRHSDRLNIDIHREKDRLVGLKLHTIENYERYETVNLTGTLDYRGLEYYTEFSLFCFLPLTTLNNFIRTPKFTVEDIFVRLKSKHFLPILRKQLKERWNDQFKIILPQNSAPLINGVYTIARFATFAIGFLLFLMVFFCSSFLIHINIDTRRKEIGIYRSIGVKKSRLGIMYCGEILFVTLFFGLMGIIMGNFVINSLANKGIDATIVPLNLIFGQSVLFIKHYIYSYIAVGGFLLISVIGNTLNAIIRLGNYNPVEILREL